MLGAIDTVSSPVSDPINIAYNPTGGAVTATTGSGFNAIETGGGMVTLPSDTDTVTYFEGGPSTGGGAAPDLREDTGVELPIVDGGWATPPEVRKQWEEANKKRKQKNMIAFGIGALVIGYLLLRKK